MQVKCWKFTYLRCWTERCASKKGVKVIKDRGEEKKRHRQCRNICHLSSIQYWHFFISLCTIMYKDIEQNYEQIYVPKVYKVWIELKLNFKSFWKDGATITKLPWSPFLKTSRYLLILTTKNYDTTFFSVDFKTEFLMKTDEFLNFLSNRKTLVPDKKNLSFVCYQTCLLIQLYMVEFVWVVYVRKVYVCSLICLENRRYRFIFVEILCWARGECLPPSLYLALKINCLASTIQ